MTRTLKCSLAQALLAASLSGCAHAPVDHDDLSYPERRSYLEKLDSWDMRGSIVVATGEQAFQGRFRWQQSADALDMSIRGPLGVSVLQITGPADRLTVRARGEVWELTDPETELSALLGWWLPVTSLNSWLLGVPDPTYPAEISLGPDNALQSLEQRLWRLTYQSYQIADGVLLPRRIDLAHRDLELRVTVTQWQHITGNKRLPSEQP